MPQALKSRLLLAWSIVGVPLIFVLFVFMSYRYSGSQGELPFLDGRLWRWFGAFMLTLGSGIGCTFLASSGGVAGRSLVATGYCFVMVVVLLFLHLVVACAQGDCL